MAWGEFKTSAMYSKKQAILGLVLTVILALIFTGFQVLEYLDAPFTIADSVFGSCF